LIETIRSASVEVLSQSCFSECGSLAYVRFDPGSSLSRIEGKTFFATGLATLIVPASVEVFGEYCILECGSLSAVKFQSGPRLS
jgi:hypothetical protein